MHPRLLLDTHIVLRWLHEPRKLSRQQSRILEQSVSRTEPVALSGVTLLEIAILFGDGSRRPGPMVEPVFEEIENNPTFRILPLTLDVAREVAILGNFLRDPADRAIVATARVHRLKLLTLDQRILESGLVPVID